MPVIQSTYKPPFYFRNGHIATMLPSMFRKVNGVNYQRERVDTPDRDFLDLDWLANRNDKAVIVFHGLEGSSQRHYVQGTARTFSTAGWDVVAVNSRSCSGELNLAPRLYHHADTDDVRFIIDHVLKTKSYQQLALVGFSMGGAMILNYLGEAGQEVPEVVKSAIAFSSPVNVGDSARELEKRGREFYLNRFLKKLKRKIKAKASQHPGLLDTEGLDGLKSFLQYDDRYTAPMHGFADAEEFYHRASSYYKIKDIAIPTLLATAANDPFMPSSCYPYEEARAHQRFYLEVPRYGGHVGFPLKSLKHSWMEARALEFAMEHTM